MGSASCVLFPLWFLATCRWIPSCLYAHYLNINLKNVNMINATTR
jgi:hypothetical protein